MTRRRLPVLAFALPVLFPVLVAGCGTKPPAGPDVPAAPAPTPTLPAAVSNGAGDAGITPAANAAPAEPAAPAGSKKIAKKQDPAWGECHAAFKAKTKDVASEVQKLAKTCEAVTKMKAVGAPQKSKQGAKNAPQTYPLKGAAGKCYRVYAESEPTIKDLDILVKDSAGMVAVEDSTDDTNPVLVEDGAFCFKEADEATLVISVGEGEGAYAFQIYSD